MTSTETPGHVRATSLAVLTKFYDAEMRYMGAGGADRGADFGELASCFHPDAVMRHGPSSPFAGDWAGMAEIRRLFDVLTDAYASGENLRLTYLVNDGGDEIAVKMRVLVTSRKTGAKVDVELGQFVSFDGGLIREFTTFYHDPLGVRRACGMDT